jgi:hypothetical protein
MGRRHLAFPDLRRMLRWARNSFSESLEKRLPVALFLNYHTKKSNGAITINHK